MQEIDYTVQSNKTTWKGIYKIYRCLFNDEKGKGYLLKGKLKNNNVNF